MNVPVPDARAGEPSVCGNVEVFPLFIGLPFDRSSDYVLASEAMSAGTLAVREVSETGKVPCLLVDNSGGRAVLFVEGEEVRGGKQRGAGNSQSA